MSRLISWCTKKLKNQPWYRQVRNMDIRPILRDYQYYVQYRVWIRLSLITHKKQDKNRWVCSKCIISSFRRSKSDIYFSFAKCCACLITLDKAWMSAEYCSVSLSQRTRTFFVWKLSIFLLDSSFLLLVMRFFKVGRIFDAACLTATLVRTEARLWLSYRSFALRKSLNGWRSFFASNLQTISTTKSWWVRFQW